MPHLTDCSVCELNKNNIVDKGWHTNTCQPLTNIGELSANTEQCFNIVKLIYLALIIYYI